MKNPTTPYSIGVQETFEITHDFLLSQDWVLDEEKPLYNFYTQRNNSDMKLSIGMYGEFSITELHWINKTPERYFSTINANLKQEDYFTIIKLLNIIF